MARILLASIIGAVVVFGWGFIAWPTMDLYGLAFHNLPDANQPMVDALKAGQLKSGAYRFPAEPDKDAATAVKDAFAARHKAGPNGMLLYRADGSDPMHWSVLALGFGFDVVACFLLACMMVAGHLKTWGMRFTLAVMMAAFAVMVSHACNWNWFNYPDGYSMSLATDVMVGWLLAGAVVAMIVKPSPA